MKQNYPNPFNPSTVIFFDLLTKGYVSLKVYNVLGQEVRTLADGYENAGTKSVTFETNDLPSDIYFYRLTPVRLPQKRRCC